MTDAFRSWIVAGERFDALLASARFEELGKGRRGTVLVKAGEATPIVRTTTQYHAPAQTMLPIHAALADAIAPGAFNNALIEHYTNAYSTMKRHSDQALDLADDSSIAVYSCYRDPSRPSRRLVVMAKEPDSVMFDIPLAHGSVVAFSLDANRRHTHAIALVERAPANDWLGITFRTSKTFVRMVGGEPHVDGTRLTLADDEQRRAFFALRRRENEETTFVYPPISYTISASDLVRPVSLAGHAV